MRLKWGLALLAFSVAFGAGFALLRGLAPDRLTKQGLFESREVTKLVDEHTAGRENHAHTLFPLMVFERWAEEYLRHP